MYTVTQNMQNRQIIRESKRTKYTKCTNYTTVAYNVEIMQNRLIILQLDIISYIIQNVQNRQFIQECKDKKTNKNRQIISIYTK